MQFQNSGIQILPHRDKFLGEKQQYLLNKLDWPVSFFVKNKKTNPPKQNKKQQQLMMSQQILI